MVLRHLFRKPSELLLEPRIPEGLRVYAIGDIHGRIDLLLQLRNLIAADLKLHPISEARAVFLGDYVDRGMESRAVVDLLATRSFPVPIIALCGNHEAMLLEFLNGGGSHRMWLKNGGLETMHSYGVDVDRVRVGRGLNEAAAQFRAKLPDAHLTFLHGLQLSFTSGDYFFCHAGIRPGIPLEAQQAEDLFWIRDEFLSAKGKHEKVVVHGHTPVEDPEIFHNRINVDTGAYISGRLTCLVLENTMKHFLVADAFRMQGVPHPITN